MLIGVTIVLDLYVQIKKFILPCHVGVWQTSVSSSCTISCIQDKDVGFTVSRRFNGSLKMENTTLGL